MEYLNSYLTIKFSSNVFVNSFNSCIICRNTHILEPKMDKNVLCSTL